MGLSGVEWMEWECEYLMGVCMVHFWFICLRCGLEHIHTYSMFRCVRMMEEY